MSIRNSNLRPNFWTMFFYILISVFSISLLSSCSDNGEDTPDILAGEYAQGYLVVNEGVFGMNNSSVGHISTTGVVTQQIFQTVTGDSLGDQLQSISILGDKAYLMVSASNKIEVVNRGTFERKETIFDTTNFKFANPRYMADVGNNKAYVSTWGNFGDTSPKILVIDTQTEQITSTIEASSGAENIIFDNNTNKAFVANGFGTTISVYNTSNNTLENTIDVSPNTPEEMVVDKDGKLWVVASPFGSSTGALYKINMSTNAIETTIALNAGSENIGEHLAINATRDILYYSFSSGVYELDITATTQTTNPIIQNGAYGVSINPKNNDIWIGIANFQAPTGNDVIQYDNQGNLINTFSAGAGSNEVIFLP
ncbi:DUF5074 domain-containing protein [Bernardetia sp. ABR2-2B]|uniref:YncE family protein n=1 Tax=Bernardetia sp. ABR2-2B TaxID=3127472 RepID=UPI0030D619F6